MNLVQLRGAVVKAPVFSHATHGKVYFQLELVTKRLSGNEDVLCVLLPEELLRGFSPVAGDCVEVEGQIRSFNNKSGQGSRLVISVLARSVRPAEGENMNSVTLYGSLCKAPIYRKTPLGREICDLLLAVGRAYGRADFIPVICWGQCARECAGHEVGTRVTVTGRFQSRTYVKLIDGQPYERVAYEISAVQIVPESGGGDRTPEPPAE